MTWRIESARRLEIAVRGGTIVCYEMGAPAPPTAARRSLPILFIPGWGGVLEGFEDVLTAVDEDVELYYLETREKGSSRVSLRSGFAMADFAADVAAAAEALGLASGEYVLVGSSFGGSVAAQALAPSPAGADLSPASTVLFEPMPRLWMHPMLVRLLGNLLPVGLVAAMKPLFRRLLLAGMKQETQRRRAGLVIDNADLPKWREAALALLGWHICGIAGGIEKPVAVVRASGDRFHDESTFPAIAAAFPRGDLVDLRVPESQRERLMGRIASACAKGRAASDLR
jgi:pimeloyl-ACP methyl ester carboxylesterase